MSWGRVAAGALVLAMAGPASAQSQGADATTTETAADAPAGNQEIGARLGLSMGGRVSPGGLHIGGSYLYRLSDHDWFDGGVGFSFGGGDPACFRDRDGELLCDHTALSGFSADVYAGVRRFLPGRGPIDPYVHGGLAVRGVSYGDDDLRGIAVPLWLGGGIRSRVHETVAVGGGAILAGGPAFMNRGLGAEPQVTLTVWAGVEFVLD